MKRKIRIAAGGVQALFRLRNLLNPFKNGILSWQYLSHKVLRWTLAPLSLFFVFILNLIIVLAASDDTPGTFYLTFLIVQVVCYLLSFIGWYFEPKKLRFKLLFVPYYFVAINYAAVRGMMRYFQGKQSASWEKSRRASAV